MPHQPSTQVYPAYKTAFWYWLKLGFISFGGPAGQIALMHRELVDEKRWISDKRFLQALNVCMVLPGPEAQQLAIYLGWLLHRTRGGITAGLLFILPSFVMLVMLALMYMQYGTQPIFMAIFNAIKPAVVAMVVYAAWRISKRALTQPFLVFVAAYAFIAMAIFKVAFPWVMLTVAMFGLMAGRLKPSFYQAMPVHPMASARGVMPMADPSSLAMTNPTVAASITNQEHQTGFLIDDDTPLPAHTQFTLRRFMRVLAIGLGLWGIMMLGLMMQFGWAGALTQMAWFFTKAALLTFGGAYAVLPYVYQGAVDYYHWLTPLQMMDGLAFGESTPGPLIMVVTFVGFVSGWGQAVIGVDSPLLLGLSAAVIVTLFTFLPSFVLIFLTAPLIEKMQHYPDLNAMLATISAAVVGMILSLAVLLALHVLMPFGFAIDTLMVDIDWVAGGLFVLALILLMHFEIKLMYLLLGFILIGLIQHFLGFI